MRYTTARFGETIFLLGDFASGRTLGQVEMTLIDLSNGSVVALSDNDCIEIAASTFGGFSVYRWSSANITTPTTTAKQYLYIMRDTITGRIQRGKFTVGGFPDESARDRYHSAVHLSTAGSALPTAGSVLAGTLTFATGATDTISKATAWPAAFAVGRRVQISGSPNRGVTTPIVALSGAGPFLLEFAGGNGFSHGAFQADSGTYDAVVKTYVLNTAPDGTDENPVNNVMDARQIADELQLHEYHFHDGFTVTVDFPHDSWRFAGGDPDIDFVEVLAGGSNADCQLFQTSIIGDLNGRITAENCIVGYPATTTTGLQGVLSRCGANGTLKLAPGGTLNALDMASRELTGTVFDFTGVSSATLLMGSVFGVWVFTNFTSGTIGLALLGSRVTFAASCTGGIAQVGGVGEIINSSPGGLVLTDEVVYGSKLSTLRREALNALASRAEIDIGNGTSDTWLEKRYTWREGQSTDITVWETYELYDQDGNAINGSHTSGNNPLFDSTRLIAERRRV